MCLVLQTFVDESYGANDYYVGGIILNDQQLAYLEGELLDLKRRASAQFGVPEDIELHAHEIMQCKRLWRCLKGSPHEQVYICKQVLEAVVASGAVVHLQGVNVRRLNARYRYPDSPYAVSLRHMLERVEEHCVRLGERSEVLLDILDESDTATAAIAGYVRRKTPGYRPMHLTSIVHPIQYADSRDHLGIQAADVVTYVLRRHLEVQVAHPKALRASRMLFETVWPAVRSNRKWEP